MVGRVNIPASSPQAASGKTGRPDNQVQIISHLSSLVSHLARIAHTSGLDDLLGLIIDETRQLVGCEGCSAYLRPSLVPKYDGRLTDADGALRSGDDLDGEFVVLAAASHPDMEPLIGRAFYAEGDGLAGWVLRTGAPLRVADAADLESVRSQAPDVQQPDRYDEGHLFYVASEPRPMLIVPLAGRAGMLGVLVFAAPSDRKPFRRTAEDVAVVIAQVVSSTLEKTLFIQEQSRNIRRLVDLGTKHRAQEVFEAATEYLGHMLHTRRCRLYLRDNGGTRVRLVAESGRALPPDADTIERGEDLVGWIFKTGKPLLLPDSRAYAGGQRLSDDDLERVSDGPPVDDDDRLLRSAHSGGHRSPLPFLAVPVKAADGTALGVLCAGDPLPGDGRGAGAFRREDLELIKSFASTIALSVANERDRKLGELLTQLGHHSEPGKLIDLVVEQVPDLVAGTSCCVYVLENTGSPTLRLRGSSRPGFGGGDPAADIRYQLGEGKTGFCALAQASLVVNHYGSGTAARAALEEDIQRLGEHEDDLIEPLLDERQHRVGLIHLRRGRRASKRARREFAQLCRSLVVRPGAGLPSPKSALHAQRGAPPAWSFLAVPINTEAGDLHGVITIDRPVECSPFSSDAIALAESLAGRLATILHSARMQERQKQLMITMAHEINTPLQGILADTENLLYELPAGSELGELIGHNLRQVQQLHLLTETIMTVLADQTTARSFSLHSMFRPLKDARDMFESEAAAKGCDILEPQSIDSRFPEVEMSLFDLTLAFKNLIHNAVKYSFRPPRGQEGRRFIRILGAWADDTHYSVAVQNYGVGLTPEEIASGSIFTPHYRGAKATDRRRTGAGLGLAHARHIVEDMHHGTIRVTSKPLHGEASLTTFVVTLPVRQPR